jgi:hypothetical protein
MTVTRVATLRNGHRLMEGMCIRCHEAEAPGSLGLCAACAINTRVEVTEGIKRFGSYLLNWSAFEAWLDEHGPSAGPIP